MYVIRILINQPLRLVLTLSGIALCIILIMFILGIYNGVAEGSVEYIKKTKADLWVLQANSTNMIRGTSLLLAEYNDVIKRDTLIKSATPVLILLTNIKVQNQNATVLLTGYVPGAGGGPPGIIDGRGVIKNNEIVLDKSFSAKHKVRVGNSIIIKEDTLTVVGISGGTNAFVTQYAFVTLEYEQSIIDLPGLASLFIINAKTQSDISSIRKNIVRKLPGMYSIYTHDIFLKNNIAEMEAGILPLFFAIALIGGVVLAIILSLILSVNILERRKDFAIMKILGSPNKYLYSLIIFLALLLSLASEAIGVALYFPLAKLIEQISPEVTTVINFKHIFYITMATCVISFYSALMSCKRIKSIYPLEVFA
jgi:ABC-type antimicrobial peptide transport system permease subunit